MMNCPNLCTSPFHHVLMYLKPLDERQSALTLIRVYAVCLGLSNRILRNSTVHSFYCCTISEANPFMPSGLFYLNSSNQSISSRRIVRLIFIITMFIEISVFNANNVDPDQTPHSEASDLGLHSLTMFLL